MLTFWLLLAALLIAAALLSTLARGPKPCPECGTPLYPWQVVGHAREHWGADA